MKLSTNSILLLKHIVTYDGKNEVVNEVETPSFRRLNGEESSQRRTFFKLVNTIISDYNDLINKKRSLLEKFKDSELEKIKKENIKPEGEDDNRYNVNMNNLLINSKEFKDFLDKTNEIIKKEQKKVHEFEVTPKTTEFLKKYFNVFGDEVGFMPADDDNLEEIEKEICV